MSKKITEFHVGDKVYSQNFGQGPNGDWEVIVEVTGPVSHLVKRADCATS